MKNWNSINVNKKTMVENYKIAIFDKDKQNAQLYTADFICNNLAQLFLEFIILRSTKELIIIYWLIDQLEFFL